MHLAVLEGKLTDLQETTGNAASLQRAHCCKLCMVQAGFVYILGPVLYINPKALPNGDARLT